MVIEMDGLRFLKAWSLPHFYFHVVTAYDIPRHRGVVIGKMDYLSPVGGFIRAKKAGKVSHSDRWIATPLGDLCEGIPSASPLPRGHRFKAITDLGQPTFRNAVQVSPELTLSADNGGSE